MGVPHLHGFCTFNVPHLKIFVPHLKLEQLATLVFIYSERLKEYICECSRIFSNMFITVEDYVEMKQMFL